MRILLSMLFTSIFLASCGDKSKVNDFGIGIHRPNSIIDNQLMFSSFEEEYSFPNWFNDSLILEKKIAKIIRKIYPLGRKIKESDSLSVLPIKTVTYQFDKKGKISFVEIILTRDNQVISTLQLKYGSLNEKIGYAPFTIVKNDGFHTKKEESTEIPMYEVKKLTGDYFQFALKKRAEQLFVMNENKNWGPFRINKKLHPAEEDRLVLGSMFRPLKSYSVENTNQESKVEKFEYRKDLITEITSVDYPFQSKRSFQYDRRGYCTSYIDSLFSEEEFLSRTISKFTNNMQFSPTQIAHVKESMNGESSFHFLEVFEYEYRN